MLDLQFETVKTSLRERVAWITLNRPESLNAFVPEMGRELLTVLDRVASDGEIRALVLTGAGRAFSSGADLKQVASWGSDGKPELLAPLREVFHPLIMRLRTIEKPVVAAVNGGAVGFGCSLALASDIVVAARSAYFLMAFANVGLTLDGGSSALLVARIGHARASEMGLLAERVDVVVDGLECDLGTHDGGALCVWCEDGERGRALDVAALDALCLKREVAERGVGYG